MTLGDLEPEFHAPWQAYKAQPSPATTTALLTAVQPILRQGVATFAGGAGPNAMSRARQLALDALPGYDPQKGKLRNHLMNRLRGLQRHTAQANQIISVPEQVALDRNHLWEHEVNLQDELGHPPSDAELANRSGLSLKRIRHIRQYKPGFAESQLAAKGRDDGGGDGWEPGVQRNRGHELLHMIYHELSPVDQLIVEHLSGFNGAPILPGQEIARRTGLTPGRVSQRAAAIQHQLDQLDDAGVL